MKQKVDQVLGGVLILFLSVTVINVIWQVFSRYVLGSPSTFTDEFSTYLLIWIGLLGASFATGQGIHLAIDLLPNKLEGQAKANLNKVITGLIVLFACCVMILGGGRLVYITLLLKQYSPTLRLPLGLVYLVIPISGILIVYYSIYHLINKKHGTH